VSVFKIGFSDAGVSTQPAMIEATTIEDALEAAWATFGEELPDGAKATALGKGMAYRYIRRSGQWEVLATHPIPELADE
jgi:hypothetical protein